jgi:hypothetical protein
VADLRRELQFITGTPEITLPSFVTLSIPLLGTPYFFDCVQQRTILPNTKLRDMDGATVLQTPMDSMDEVVKFVRDIQNLRGFRARIVKHAIGFTALYGSKLGTIQMALALGAGLMICAQSLTQSFSNLGWLKMRPKPRTFISSTEQLDHMYTPAFRVDSRFESYFKPTMVTNECGELHEDMIRSGVLQLQASPLAAARA